MLARLDEILQSFAYCSIKTCRHEYEFEADYIGSLLMASAGYDPRGALVAQKKLEESGGCSEFDSLDTHPSGKRRTQRLAEAQEEAMSLYMESLSSGVRTIFNVLLKLKKKETCRHRQISRSDSNQYIQT